MHQLLEVEVRPAREPNVLQLEVFMQGKGDVVLPFPCTGLAVESRDQNVKTMPTKAVVSIPQLDASGWNLTQFSFTKAMGKKERVVFQHIELYAWDSA